MEEQDKQLAEIHKNRVDRSADKPPPKKGTKPPEGGTEKHSPVDAPAKAQGRGCFRCGSQRHRARECPHWKPPGEASGRLAPSNQVVASDETLDVRYAELQAELAEIEHRRMKGGYTGCVGVDLVSRATGPTYYAKVKIEGTVVSSKVDPGSSATIISYEKFCEIGKQAGIPAGNLERPDLVLTT